MISPSRSLHVQSVAEGELVIPRVVAPLAPRTAAAAGRLQAIVDEHLSSVWRFLRRLGLSQADVDDAVQEVVMVAAKRLDEIDPASERAFLLSTAYRVAHGMRRSSARFEQLEDDESTALEDPAPAADDLTEQKRLRETLDALLLCMPLELRAVFVLHEIEGLTMADIATLLALPSGTVASRLRRARRDFDGRLARLEACSQRRRGAS